MRILGLVCSPRLHGNTEIMVRAALDKAQQEGADVELVTLAGKTISPCDACYSCRKTGKCQVEDDMQDIYTKLSEADGIIFGTPVYFWSVSAQAKALIDRTRLFSDKRELRNKVAGVVTVQAGRGDIGALNVFSGFFAIQKMIMVGYATGFGSQEKGDVMNDEKGLKMSEALGKTMVKYIQSHEIPA
ncbi:flavodoxin family protein [Chloroflexota bacterium]